MFSSASIKRYFSYDDDLLRRVMLLFFLLMPVFILLGRSVLDAAISTIAVSFIIHSLYWRDFSWLQNRWVQVVFLFWFYMMLNSLHAFDIKLALKQAVPFIRFPIFAVAVSTWIIKRPSDLKWFVAIFAGTLIFSMLDGYFEFIVGYDFVGNAIFEGRLSGPFERSTLGIYLTKGGLPICVALFGLLHLNRDHLSGGLYRILLGIMSLLLVILVVLSGERMAVLLLMFGLVLLIWQIKAYRSLLLGLSLVMVVALGAVVAYHPPLKERFYNQTMADVQKDRKGAFGYKELFILSGKLIKDHTLLGVGPNNYRVICSDPKYLPNHPRDFTCLLHPHNVYLELWVNHGIIGVLLFVSMVFFWFRMMARKLGQAGHAKYILLSGTLAAILFLWPFSVGMSIFSNFNGSFFWMMMAFMLASFRIFTPDHSGEKS